MPTPSTMRLAVLMTCHNRRETTLTCLRTLYGQALPPRAELRTYLVDDGSTDGTGAAVAREFPAVRVLRGNGHLYWCGGMRLAWAEALKGGYEHYLWLNDDTHLYPDALATMLATWSLLRCRKGEDLIVTGATQDAITRQVTYSGVTRFSVLEPGTEPRRCETTCGNCVLVPAAVASKLGNLSGSFTHQLGDFDYGLRGARKGIECWIAPGYVGTCSQHAIEGSHLDATVPIPDRLRMMRSPAGPPPLREWMVFTYRHLGWRWPIYWLRAVVRVCFPAFWLVVRSRREERSATR